jgi:hypothetical protein
VNEAEWLIRDVSLACISAAAPPALTSILRLDGGNDVKCKYQRLCIYNTSKASPISSYAHVLFSHSLKSPSLLQSKFVDAATPDDLPPIARPGEGGDGMQLHTPLAGANAGQGQPSLS